MNVAVITGVVQGAVNATTTRSGATKVSFYLRDEAGTDDDIFRLNIFGRKAEKFISTVKSNDVIAVYGEIHRYVNSSDEQYLIKVNDFELTGSYDDDEILELV